MILHAVTLTNFRQHQNSTVFFERGLTGLLGSNGSGKSTILEAVGWGFFGAEAVRSTMSTVKWQGAPKTQKAQVSVHFTVAGVSYLLTRTEDSAKVEAVEVFDGYEIVDSNTVAATPKEVSAFMQGLLGLTFREFSATYLAAQKDVMHLQTLGPEDRRRFMLRVLGAERMEKAVKDARASANALRDAALLARADVGQREPLVEEVVQARLAVRDGEAAHEIRVKYAEARTAEAREAWAAAQRSAEKHEQHQRLTRELSQAKNDLAQAGRDAERLRAEIEECEGAASRAGELALQAASLPALRAEHAQQVQARADARLREELRASLRLAEDEHRYQHTVVQAYDAAAHQQVGQYLAEAEAALREEQQERQERRAEIQAAITAALEQHKVLRERTEALEGAEDATCPTCRRALGDTLREVVGAMKQELLEIGARGAWLREELDAVQPGVVERATEANVHSLATQHAKLDIQQADAARATESLPALQRRIDEAAERLASMSEVSFDAGLLAALTNHIVALEAVEREAAGERARASRVDGLLASAVDTEARALTAAQDEARASVGLRELAFDPDAHAALERQAEDARQAREEARAALARAEAALESARERESRAVAALEKHDADAEAVGLLEQEHRTEARAAERLAALKTGFVQTIRPELEHLVSGFVATLTDGRYESAAIDEDFGVKLYRGGIAVDVASGGEEDVVAIALRLATSLMIAERSGHALQCVILDEPFGSLDAVRRRNVLELLTHRLRGLFEQVIVISHFEDVEQAVEHAVVLEYDDARATSTVRTLSLAGVA